MGLATNGVPFVARLAQSLILRRDLGHRAGVSLQLEDFAWVACARGQPRRATRLLGAADALRRAIGWTVPSLAVRDRESLISGLHAQLSEAQYATEYAAGSTLAPDQAIGEALELASSGRLAAGRARAGRPRGAAGPAARKRKSERV
jgi:hypothetical protein